MDILVVKSHIPSEITMGTDVVSYNLLRLLSLDNHVSLLGMTQSRGEQDQTGRLRGVCENVFTILAPHRKSPFHRLYYKVLNLLKLFFLFRSPEASYSTPRGLKMAMSRTTEEHHYDLVIIEYWYHAALRSYVRGNPRVVLLIHDAAFMDYHRRQELEESMLKRTFMRFFSRIKKWEELRSIAKFDQVLALSSKDIQHIREGGLDSERITFRTLPVSISAGGEHVSFRGRDEAIEDSLYFIGRLDRSDRPNNLDAVRFFLEKVYPRLEKIVPNVRFYIIGECPPGVREELLEMAPVHFQGFVDDPEKEVLKYRVCVAPLRIGSGIKIKILEAFCLGIPVVTTSVGAEGIDYFDTHYEAVRDGPGGFAEEVGRLLKDEDYYSRVRKSQRKYSQENLTLESNRKRVADAIMFS